jgi:hypothetical protein
VPTRLLFDLGGQVDQTGNAVVSGGMGHRQPTTSHAQAKVTAALSEGTGNWAIEIVRAHGQQGSLIGSTAGAGIETSFILAPGELIQATVSNATPGATVRGSVMGTQAYQAAALPPMYAGGSFSIVQPPPTPPAPAIIALESRPGQHPVLDLARGRKGEPEVILVTYHYEPD